MYWFSRIFFQPSYAKVDLKNFDHNYIFDDGDDEDDNDDDYLICPLFIVDGGWSAWSGLSRCTRACGGGRQYQSRTCSNPFPGHGGRDCVGVRSLSFTCNTQCCPGAFTHNETNKSVSCLYKTTFIVNIIAILLKHRVACPPHPLHNTAKENQRYKNISLTLAKDSLACEKLVVYHPIQMTTCSLPVD